MRYQIPKGDRNKEILEQEQKRIVLSASDSEAARVQKTLSFIANYAGSTNKYNASPQEAYNALYQSYLDFKLVPMEEVQDENGEKKRQPVSVDKMFPNDVRNNRHFQAELEKLWRVMELYSLLREEDPQEQKETTLAGTYDLYQADPDKYDKKLRDKEVQEQLEAPLQNQNGSETFTPIDEKSPYYDQVSGTAYMELQDSWMKLQNSPSAGELKGDMEKLLSIMQLHYLTRSGTGAMLPMKQAEYSDLQFAHDVCLGDLEQFTDAEKNGPEYKAMHSLLVQNQKALNSLSPDEELPPLGDVIRGAKDPVVYLQDTENNTVGKNLSSRQTVEYIDETGKLRQGIFTPEKELAKQSQDAKKLMNLYIRTYPEYENYLKKIKNNRNIYNRIETAAINEEKKSPSNALEVALENFKWIREDDKDGDFKKVFMQLAKDIKNIKGYHYVFNETGIQAGDKLANRSSAMCDVAEALGFPKLLAKSRRVTVKQGDKEIPGIMMEEADPDALDTDSLPKGHPFFNMDQSQFDNKDLLSSLADLQILDYLCGNTDRHASNFFLKMDFSDPNAPKIRGVQGIDNDNSFGSISEGGIFRLADKENLKVITGKMAEAVKNMKPEKLEEILAPYGFRREQISAAKIRLQTLQDMISKYEKKGRSGVYDGKLVNEEDTIFIAKEDKDWKKLTMNALIPEMVNGERPSNIYWMADSARCDLKQYQKKMGRNAQMIPEKAPVLNDKALMDPIRYNDHGLKGTDLKKLEELRTDDCEILKNAKKLFLNHGGQDLEHRTREYKDMSTALDNYIRKYEDLGKVLRGEDKESKDNEENLINPVEKKKDKKNEKSLDEKLKEGYSALEQARKALEQSIRKYDKKKHVLFLRGDSMERCVIARKLLQTVQEKPESVKFYETGNKLQEQHKERMSQKTDSQLAAYLSEQIGSQMKNRLLNNLKQLREDDPVHVQGLKALKAQERLWNYSQTVTSDGMLSVKNIQGENAQKQKTSLKLMQYDIRKKLAEKADPAQIYEDVKIIRDYVDAQGKKEEKKMALLDKKLQDKKIDQAEQIKLTKMREQSANRLNESRALYEQIDGLVQENGKKEIGPRYVRDMLNKVYKNEMSIAEQNQPEKTAAVGMKKGGL